MKNNYIKILSATLIIIFIAGCAPVSDTALSEEDKIYPMQSIKVASISSQTYSNTFAIDELGQLYGSGRNINCQLGDASSICSNVYQGLKKTSIQNAKEVVGGAGHTLVLLNDGSLRTVGDNSRGQLGLPASEIPIKSFAVPNFENINKLQNPKIVKIATSFKTSYALDIYGNIWGAGLYYNGQLGSKTGSGVQTSSSIVFTNVSSASGVKFVDIAGGYDGLIAVDENNGLWVTGNNRQGQLGLGSVEEQRGLIKLVIIDNGSSVKFKKVSAGGSSIYGDGTDAYVGDRHTLAIDIDGNIWATGSNSKGQLGDNTTIGKNTFTKVTSDIKFVTVSAGSDFSAAIDSDGQIYTCGNNASYTLSLGTMGYVTKWTKVSNPPAVSGFKTVVSGIKHLIALDNSGRVWVGGANDNGQLALNIKATDVTMRWLSARGNFEAIVSAVGVDTAKHQDNLTDPSIAEDNSSLDENFVRVAFIGDKFLDGVPEKLEILGDIYKNKPWWLADGKNHFTDNKSIKTRAFLTSDDNLTTKMSNDIANLLKVLGGFKPHYVVIKEADGETSASGYMLMKALITSFGAEPLVMQRGIYYADCLMDTPSSDKWGMKRIHYRTILTNVISSTLACTESHDALIIADNKLTRPNDPYPNYAGGYLAAMATYDVIAQFTVATQSNANNAKLLDNMTNPDPVKIDNSLWITPGQNVNLTAITNRALHMLNWSGSLSKVQLTIDNYNKTIPNPLNTLPYEELVTFSPYKAVNITFTTTERGRLDIEMPFITSKYYMLLTEGSRRLIGMSGGGNSYAWPLDSSDGCLDNTTMSFNTPIECMDNSTYAKTFFANGERIGEYGIPYENQIVPAGTYKLTIIEAKGLNSSLYLKLRIIP